MDIRQFPDEVLVVLVEHCDLATCSTLENTFPNKIFRDLAKTRDKNISCVGSFTQLLYLKNLSPIKRIVAIVRKGDFPEIIEALLDEVSNDYFNLHKYATKYKRIETLKAIHYSKEENYWLFSTESLFCAIRNRDEQILSFLLTEGMNFDYDPMDSSGIHTSNLSLEDFKWFLNNHSIGIIPISFYMSSLWWWNENFANFWYLLDHGKNSIKNALEAISITLWYFSEDYAERKVDSNLILQFAAKCSILENRTVLLQNLLSYVNMYQGALKKKSVRILRREITEFLKA